MKQAMYRFRNPASTQTSCHGKTSYLFRWLLLVACSIGLLPQIVKAEALTLAEDGSSPYVIAYAQGVGRSRVMVAAEALQMFLAESTGVTLPIVAESQVPSGKPAIYLGWSKAARRAGLSVETVTNWSYLNQVVGQDVFLVGEDRPTLIAPGSRARTVGVYGSLKAVTAFLQDQVGVSFLMPGENGTYVPKRPKLTIDAGMNKRWSPVFRDVSGRMANYFSRHQKSLRDTAFGVANHMFGASEFLYDYGGHSYYEAIPAAQYGSSHPEYFALVAGSRHIKGNHLCISNPQVQELMLQEMQRQLDRGFQWVELGQTDGYIPCECDACQAIDPDVNERVWIIHRQLAQEMKKRCPGKTIMILSYQATRQPPKTFDTFPDNVAIRMTRYRPEDFAAWERWGGKDLPKAIYTTNWLSIHPRISAYVAGQQTLLFARNHIESIYLCGGIIQNGKGNWYPWGLGGPGYHAFFESLHDPSIDPAAARAAYINAAFGQAAPAMQNFFETLDDRMDQFWWLFRADPFNGPPSRLVSSNEDFNLLFYPQGMLQRLDNSLARAQQDARSESPQVQAHLKLVAMEYDYLRSHAMVYHAYRAYRLAPSVDSLERLAEHVQTFHQVRDTLWPEGKNTPVDGLPAPFSGTSFKLHREIAQGSPFNWDFATLLQNNVLPGMENRQLQATAVTGNKPVNLDGRLDDAAWQAIPFTDIGQIALGKAPYKTRFKMARGDNGLYIAFEAQLESPDALDHLTPVGRDGVAWRQENMELVIDPKGTRRMYYHFIINPLADSSLDRRFGYHQSPDHLLYQDFEWDWNGDWQYAAHIDKAASQWTAEVYIPYATLEAQPPAPGETWTFNIGRTQFLKSEGEEPATAIYLWSPNVESRTFHDMSAFGELIFR